MGALIQQLESLPSRFERDDGRCQGPVAGGAEEGIEALGAPRLECQPSEEKDENALRRGAHTCWFEEKLPDAFRTADSAERLEAFA